MPKPKEQQRIAVERIRILFDEAEKAFAKDKMLSNEYVQKARKIGMRYEVPVPRELKRRFCKHCHSFLMPGKNLRVRTHNNKVVYFCRECKHFMRFPFIREKKLRRKKTI
jgi:ribonuclease P protein subunit RPR2